MTAIIIALLLTLNIYRMDVGLSPLAQSPVLTIVAQQRADAMVANDVFSHADGAYIGLLAQEGVRQGIVGEIIGRSTDPHVDILLAWQSSPSHNLHLLYPEYTEVGLGTAHSDTWHYFVIVFWGP